mmetsp:Transcript_17636/g.41428  ORF Transcript_17636/g.41428 Transcript_17636/m.41428 type:complete len:246 (-) Transcript_17636:980-1717(-)
MRPASWWVPYPNEYTRASSGSQGSGLLRKRLPHPSSWFVSPSESNNTALTLFRIRRRFRISTARARPREIAVPPCVGILLQASSAFSRPAESIAVKGNKTFADELNLTRDSRSQGPSSLQRKLSDACTCVIFSPSIDDDESTTHTTSAPSRVIPSAADNEATAQMCWAALAGAASNSAVRQSRGIADCLLSDCSRSEAAASSNHAAGAWPTKLHVSDSGGHSLADPRTSAPGRAVGLSSGSGCGE